MKTIILKILTVLFISLFVTSCGEEDDDFDTNITNQVVFWSDFQGPPISITIKDGNGSGTITAISDSSPDCGSSGSFTRTLSPGSYTYTARDGNLVWNNGRFTINEYSSCTTVLLTD
jgi:hypothetical protein